MAEKKFEIKKANENDYFVLEALLKKAGVLENESEDDFKKILSRSIAFNCAYENGEPVGFIRCVGDGIKILYIREIYAQSNYGNEKIYERLLESVISKYKNCEQILTAADRAGEIRKFYLGNGFKTFADLNVEGLIYVKRKENEKDYGAFNAVFN